ncbi:N(4)-acetylcytidine aminohydrolase [Yersinia pekkanenii]|uniref:N(4)-acetylcytidine amidohydrolase n=1 Tax=Yersinia pekkanenii TaxID=1288385 RepID=A0A0T9Q547_9GAMM|nr:N(4)-acetylcytidine aminohydrolase [Yersinia pekkanenii]CNH96513.1 ASCH domain [Yersinia pekkanenii]CRY64415.1 ASCH domain [Yersinia pekkanenii]
MHREITFFRRFEADILADRKTITIRDSSESDVHPGEILRVCRNEDDVFFCHIKVSSVTPVTLDALSERHAEQENMSLDELKKVIMDIYPGLEQFYVIEFTRCYLRGIN